MPGSAGRVWGYIERVVNASKNLYKIMFTKDTDVEKVRIMSMDSCGSSSHMMIKSY